MDRSYELDGDWIDELVDTGTPPNNPARIYQHAPYRHLRVGVSGDSIVNDGADTVTVTVGVVDGLEVVRGTDLANATVLDTDGDVVLRVDGVETVKTIAGGSVSFDVTTERPAGGTIDIVAESLTDHPATPDSATIEVTE